jgi:hypothetical protein
LFERTLADAQGEDALSIRAAFTIHHSASSRQKATRRFARCGQSWPIRFSSTETQPIGSGSIGRLRTAWKEPFPARSNIRAVGRYT